MRLKVTAGAGVIVGHKWRLNEEEFEVSDALGQQFLEQHPGALAVMSGVAAGVLVEGAVETQEPAALAYHEMNSWPTTPVTSLAISQRVLDALDANGIKTELDLRAAMVRGDAAMLALPGIGPRALDELKQSLAGPQQVGEGA